MPSTKRDLRQIGRRLEHAVGVRRLDRSQRDVEPTADAVGFSIVLPRPHRELVALPVKPNVAREPVGIVTLKNGSLSPAAQVFIKRVRELTKPLAKGK